MWTQWMNIINTSTKQNSILTWPNCVKRDKLLGIESIQFVLDW